MSKRAEQKAFQAYPSDTYVGGESCRRAYKEGYEQAEKDIIDLIESRKLEILGDAQPAPVLRAELRELINKIKEK